MDFARPHLVFDSTASRSRITTVDIDPQKIKASTQHTDPTTSDLDTLTLEAANKAAAELFLGSSSSASSLEQTHRVDAQDYKDECLPPQSVIQEGDLVVILINFDNLSFVYAKHKAIFSNRHGHFHHDDFIGKPFGCKVRSRDNRGYGFCYLLKPTPELWTRSLNHRTQIVHELDQSQIVHQLWLRPNMTVVESGTGSAALSHALLRTIAPYGHLHTYEFHPKRAESARIELQQHTSPAMVTVHHKDVCGKVDDDNDKRGGFDLPGQSVDAVFLDLPEPWRAIPHAAFILRPNGRIASYSPCVEQAQRAIQALKASGFHAIQTMEYRFQEHYVDNVSFESLPGRKRKRLEKHDPLEYLEKNGTEKDTCADNNVDHSGGDEGAKSGDKVQTIGNQEATGSTNEAGDGGNKTTDATEGDANVKVRTIFAARGFPMMRGHTAFLTFATAGNLPQPDPNLPETCRVNSKGKS